MKRALVTGGCGFVGRHFVRRLLDDGWNVVVIDDLSTGMYGAEWLTSSELDSASVSLFYSDCRNWFFDYRPSDFNFELIIHCAAVVGGRLKIDGDPLAVATDLAIDSDFFNWVVKAKNKPKVVYFSSSAVYPIELQRREQHVKLSELLVHPANGFRIGMPDVSYGWSKLTGELLAQWAVKQYGADVVIYRPFSGYGEDQSFDYPFPSIIRRVVNKENPITIWGSGDQCRDFIHIDDIVEAVMQTKDVFQPGEVLNLGTGIPTSFFDLAEKACEVTGFKGPKILTDSSKPEGVFYRVADTYKMSQFYKPKVSLEEGIRRVVAHLRESGNAKA